MVLGLMIVAFLWLLGLSREALAFAVIGGIVGFIAFVGDYTLGEVVGRSRPLPEASGVSFPSGHVFGSTVIFGFWGVLAVYYRLNKKLLVPLLAIIAVFLLSVGVSRIHLQAHWPSDVAAGYMLGILMLLVLVPLFFYLRRATWLPLAKQGEDLTVEACESCRVEKSIASVVVLDPAHGTATKIYKPPPVIRLLYWLAFQSKFPYISNSAAPEAAAHRRKIASLLTIYKFGKDLVAPVTAISCAHGTCSFVTEFVPGEKVKNDEQAKDFLAQVSEVFSEAGLSVWQVNPHNPHAHTNLIRTPEGDFKVIDLESAVVTLLPSPGQWRSALKRGSIPVFDDIDFPCLRRYVSSNEAALQGSLGPEGMSQLNEAVDLGERAIQTWKDAELRIWGRLTSRIYRLLDFKGFLQHFMGALVGADKAAEAFLLSGIERWEKEGRLGNLEAATLRTYISSSEAKGPLRHLGAHLVISAILRFPLGSVIRLVWTAVFWGKALRRNPGNGTGSPVQRAPNIHNPLVMALAIIPGFGAIAYLAARPLRRKLLIRLMVDQVAWRLPFKLHQRTHLGRWLAPAPLYIASLDSDSIAA